ncbi:MAG: sulfur carrier protein ThiS [Endozoicomonas sp.]
MQIKVNDQPLEIVSPLSLQQLLEHLQQGEQGVALAVNRKIVSRSQWATQKLRDGDEITLIRATAGG